MLGTRLQRITRAIYPVKPPARLSIPHDLAERTKPMLSRLVQFCLAGKVAQQFSSNPRLPRLEFEQLLLRAISLPFAIEATEKTSAPEIQQRGNHTSIRCRRNAPSKSRRVSIWKTRRMAKQTANARDD